MTDTISAKLASAGGKTGLYYKNMVTGQTLKLNAEAEFTAASIIKLPLLACIYMLEYEGILDMNECLTISNTDKVAGCGAIRHMSGQVTLDIGSLCRLMTVISDNTATNALIRKYGREKYNARFSEMGLASTRINRLLCDDEAHSRGIENIFTPAEIGLLLEKLYRYDFVSPSTSAAIIDILLEQQINHKIPAGLPPDILVAHKTGEDDGITHDAGIIYADEPFVLVFASQDTDVHIFEQVIRDVTASLYRGI